MTSCGYTNKLNATIEGTDLEGKSIEDILTSGTLSVGVRNNGGGYFVTHVLGCDVSKWRWFTRKSWLRRSIEISDL